MSDSVPENNDMWLIGHWRQRAQKAEAALAAAPTPPVDAVPGEAQQRKLFETRARKSGYSLLRDGDEYRHPPTQHAWQGWMMGAEVAPAPAKGEVAAWTIIGPDGWTFSGAKPADLLVPASRHENEINPVAAKQK